MILVVGSVALDTIKTPFGKVERFLGGSAVHFAVAASILGQVGIVGVVGADFDDSFTAQLKRKGIDVEGLQKVSGKTFHWEGFYEYDMNQAHTVKTELGVFQNFQPEIPDKYKPASIVFLANIDPDLQLKVVESLKKPQLIVGDTMNYWIENKKEKLIEVIRRSDIMLMNDGEARQMFNTPNIVKAAKRIMTLGPKVVIIKKGEHGGIMFTPDTMFVAPAFPLDEVVDPTGAGDSFAGGFVSFLSRDLRLSDENLRKAIIFGTVIASFTVSDFGSRALYNLQYAEIKQRYAKLMKYTQFGKI
ncbi:MAG: sugar kinase [Spirochaetes bacterium]|nr:sugar kinase [Spirochaetota bacterium]